MAWCLQTREIKRFKCDFINKKGNRIQKLATETWKRGDVTEQSAEEANKEGCEVFSMEIWREGAEREYAQ